MQRSGEIILFDRVARLGRVPLARMLALSFSLHLAIIMIIQPRGFPPVVSVPPITARLVGKVTAMPPPATPSVEAETPEAALDPLPPTPRFPPVPAVPPPAAARPSAGEPGPQAAASPARDAASVLPAIPVMVDTTWYSARQLDASPKALEPINPAYPAEAIAEGIEGTVKLMLKVDEFGAVREAEIEESDPPGTFDAAALEAFETARFAPAKKDGRAVRAQIYIRVTFELD